MTKLHVVDRHAGLPVYPLPLEACLSTFDWWPFHGSKLLTPRIRASVHMQDRGRLLAFWDHAMREGQPAGTLPVELQELAVIGECAHDAHTAGKLMEHVLVDWTKVLCRSEDGAREAVRLTHPVFQEMAVEAWQKRQRAAAVQQERTEHQRRRRVSDRMKEVGAGHMASNPATVDWVLRYLDAQGCRSFTRARVEAALEAFSTPSESEAN